MSDVWFHMSEIWCLISNMPCLMSDIPDPMSDVWCLISNIRCLTLMSELMLTSDVWCPASKGDKRSSSPPPPPPLPLRASIAQKCANIATRQLLCRLGRRQWLELVEFGTKWTCLSRIACVQPSPSSNKIDFVWGERLLYTGYDQKFNCFFRYRALCEQLALSFWRLYMPVCQ